MMYRLKKEYKDFSEDLHHDLWKMIRSLQEVDTNGNKINLWQRDEGNQMLSKYFEPDVPEDQKQG